MSSSSLNSLSAPVYQYLLFQGAAPWMAQYLAVKLAQALRDQALSIVQLMNTNGWSVEQVYNLDQSNRIWRTHTTNLFALQRLLTDELGFSPEKSKNILIQQTPIVEQAADRIRTGVSVFLELSYDPGLIRSIAERSMFALCREPEQIRSWQQAIEADNLNPLDNLRLLSRRNSILFPDAKPRAIPPRQYILEATEPLSEPAIPPPPDPVPASTAPEAILDLPADQPSIIRADQLIPIESPETIPQALWETQKPTIKAPAIAMPVIPRLPDPPKVSPSRPPSFRASPKPETVGRLPEQEITTPVRRQPAPEDPPAQDWVDGHWDEKVQLIIENALPQGGAKTWAAFRQANPWLDEREPPQAKNLQLLHEWFALPKVIDRTNETVLFFAGILLGRDLIRETNPDPARKSKKADWEKRLPSILELPTHVLWFRLYVARRLLEVSPPDYPRVLLLRWEEVSGAQDEYAAVRPFSLPPPALEQDQAPNETRLRAVAAELRYRKNEVESRNIKLPAGRRVKPAKLTQRRKRLICILASKQRARFLERLEEISGSPRSTRFPTRDDARWLLSRPTRPKA